MSEEMIVENCSPTLAGLKTANLFACDYDTQESLRRQIRSFNRTLVPKGLCMLPLQMKDHRALIYIYRPGRLKADLSDAETENLLAQFGYPAGNPNQCVARLIGRLEKCEDFPHEIGLFLGYPRRMCGALSSRERRTVNMQASGKSTEMRRRPEKPLPYTGAAWQITGCSGKKERVWRNSQ